MKPSQVILHSVATVVETGQAVLNPDAQNVQTSDDSLMSSSAVAGGPTKVSNELKKTAEVNFNAELLMKMFKFYGDGVDVNDVKEIVCMIKQRMAQIKNPQFECTLIDQQQFIQALSTKLKDFEREVSPNMANIFQELFDMLQSDNLCPSHFVVPYFEYLSDVDLFKYIVNDSDSATAQRILRSRKLQLKSISFDWKFDSVELKLTESVLGDASAGNCDPRYRIFQHGAEVNMVDEVLRLFNIIMQFYDVSQSSISLRSDGSPSGINYRLLRSAFGAPPMYHNDKIQIEDIIIESHGMTDFLRWLSPINVSVCAGDCEVFIDEPSLISGVDCLTIKCRKDNVDRFMENCTTRVIRIEGEPVWSEASILRVVNARKVSGCPRQIFYRCLRGGTGIRTVKGWKELFESWWIARRINNIGRNVTVDENPRHQDVYVKLTLY